MDHLLTLGSVAQAKGHTGCPRGHSGLQPRKLVLLVHFAERPCPGPEESSLKLNFLPCVSCVTFYLFFVCFQERKHPCVGTACISTSPGAVETSNSPTGRIC